MVSPDLTTPGTGTQGTPGHGTAGPTKRDHSTRNPAAPTRPLLGRVRLDPATQDRATPATPGPVRPTLVPQGQDAAVQAAPGRSPTPPDMDRRSRLARGQAGGVGRRRHPHRVAASRDVGAVSARAQATATPSRSGRTAGRMPTGSAACDQSPAAAASQGVQRMATTPTGRAAPARMRTPAMLAPVAERTPTGSRAAGQLPIAATLARHAGTVVRPPTGRTVPGGTPPATTHPRRGATSAWMRSEASGPAGMLAAMTPTQSAVPAARNPAGRAVTPVTPPIAFPPHARPDRTASRSWPKARLVTPAGALTTWPDRPAPPELSPRRSPP